ncbi:MAG TPA: S8 family serine peptidase, partial [Thermoanaerobaculia bacterium]|nr:S8 family serine peptidase [Thermoanaerobaculia bacterium]
YDFLYAGDDPNDPHAYDNALHGTMTAGAAVADRGTPIVHDLDDAIAPGAKMIVQDGGYIGPDACSQRPGFGCPVNLTPILTQAYSQGARIHSNSWGDQQGFLTNVPTANYSQSARDVDAFVYGHPDFLVVFNTGNDASGFAQPQSLSAPGCAKNTIQVGGTRTNHFDDRIFSWFSRIGPTRDGRLKPDVIAPAQAYVPASDGDITTNNCDTSYQGGTSLSSPAVAGAAALVRQYYTSGFYPTGTARPADAFTPSAALLKATIIASARPATIIEDPNGAQSPAPAAPNYQQGFGFPVLDDALYFPGDVAKLRVSDAAAGLAQDETTTIRLSASGKAPLRVVLVWTDPPGVPRGVNDATPELVNDLDLRVVDPAGVTHYGNEALHPHQADRLNNVEAVLFDAPSAGVYTITINANTIRSGGRQAYALVITGDVADAPSRTRSVRHL